MRRFSEAEKGEILDSIERGEAARSIARRLGRAHGSIMTLLRDNAGRRPHPPSSSDLHLTLAERAILAASMVTRLVLKTPGANLAS